MTMIAELKPLTESLAFPRYVAELQALWEDEQQRRSEFIDWLEPNTKAEFINGEVIMHSPAKKRHVNAMKRLSALMDAYVDLHELGFVGIENVLISLTRNDYLPDVCFFGIEKSNMQNDDQMRFPPPDLIAEILSPSTEKTDRETKAEDYAAHGVWEYWLIDPVNQTVEQYILHGGSYDLRLKVRDGLLQSDVIEDFEIPVKAIFDGKIKNRVLREILAGGLAS